MRIGVHSGNSLRRSLGIDRSSSPRRYILFFFFQFDLDDNQTNNQVIRNSRAIISRRK